MRTLGVGVIGANAERGWARESHVPAIASVDGLDLTAVATRRRDSAEAAARAFGARRAYVGLAEMLQDPAVDIITVAAAVPAHRDLILAALAAGKHVVTEWPVGVSTAETVEIAAAAQTARGRGLHTAVGLQARRSPAAVAAATLVAEGRLGRIVSVRTMSTTAAFGRVVAEEGLPLELPETGMNLTTIQVAHTLDLVQLVAGDFEDVSALSAIQYPRLEVPGRREGAVRTLADHVLVIGHIGDGGALASVEVIGGRPEGHTPFVLEVTGTAGSLTLTGGAPRGFQSGRLALSLDAEAVPVDDFVPADAPDAVVNVAHVYAALRADIGADIVARGEAGTPSGAVPDAAPGVAAAPSFEHAARLARLVDVVRARAEAR